ncbi:hypothetical protein KKA95_00845, partial [Patescibacteria group bacterium]|nr:hypothetical protein [Patescibacteria group bacterium]
MKRLLLLFIPALLLLSACVSTNVYPGEKEGREYQSQNTRVCETIKFECDEGEVPFNDYTGCGCDLMEGYEPTPVEEPVVDIECGIVGDEQVNCPEDTFCGTVEIFSSEPRVRCLPDDICEGLCPEDSECVIMESYPAQVRCNEIMEEEEVAEEEEAVENTNEEVIEEEEVVEEEVAEEEIVEESVEEETAEEDAEWVTEEEVITEEATEESV